MKEIVSLGVFSIALSGCASGPAPVQYQDVSIPELNQVNTVFLGESMLEQAKGVHADSVTLSGAVGVNSIVEAGKYCRLDPTSNEFHGGQKSISIKNLVGATIGHSSFVTYELGDNKVCPNGHSAAMGLCYTADEMDIDYKENDFCTSPNSMQYIIEYNGKAGDILNFTYREFSENMARPAFTTDFKMDLSESDLVGYKGARLQVLGADNSKITYKVIANFNKR